MDADVKAAFDHVESLFLGRFTDDDDENPATAQVNVIQEIKNTRHSLNRIMDRLDKIEARLPAPPPA
jgi:hypothetical protein